MNITDNLMRIKEGKDNIIKSLKNKGVDIPDNTLINEIPTIIDNVEIGGGGDTPVQPDVPELVQKYEGATVFRIEVPTDNYEFSINLCNDASKATYDVDWGDGNLESGLTTDEQHHTYSKAGIYDVNIYNISKDITLGGYYTTAIINGNYKYIYYLFNNTNNDFWGSSYIENNDYICSDILIGKGIYTFGDYAFSGCNSLISINIPDSVTSIGSNIFQNCSSLISINIPDSVTSIGSDAFKGCNSLISINIPDSLTSIGSDAFSGCNSLISINIPDSVTSIGSNVFQNCSSLTSINIPKNVTSIGLYTFYGCYSLQNINIPDSVTSIGSYAFSGCNSLIFINIPDSVTSIGSNVFQNCSSLISINIPDSVTSIGSYAFSGCNSLIFINIPDSLTSIGNFAFSGCYSLQNINIPDSVTSIGSNVFQNCSSLISINIPDSVTSIGSDAFKGCNSLISINIPDSLTSIGNFAFSGCYSLQNINIPDSLTSIGSNVFSGCMSLQNIDLSNVSSIGSQAFYNCISLQSITFNGKNTPTIQSNTFLTSNFKYIKRYLYVPKDSVGYDSGNFKTYLLDKGWELRYIEDRVKTPTTLKLKTTNNFLHDFKAIGQANLVDYELIDNEYIYHFDDKIPELAQYTFYNKVLEDIELPEGLEIIGNNTFQTCSSLQSIVIPDSVTTIGNYAFQTCSSLQSIVIPDSVTTIGNNTFKGCASLQSIVIPDSVTSIGNYAFTGCSKLSTITCKAMTAPTIQSETFFDIGSNVPSGTPKILRVPEGADYSTWLSKLSGFTLEYVPLSEL